MNIWSTFRLVPPIGPQAVAWAIVSLATYLAAIEYPPSVWGFEMDPLALAIAVQLTLSISYNMTFSKFRQLTEGSPLTVGLVAVLIFVPFWCLAFFGTAALAAWGMTAYYLLHAALLMSAVMFHPDRLGHRQSTWAGLDAHRNGAVLLEACGLLACAATLATVWVFAGSLAFAAMMTSGVILLRIFTNWIIVLYLLGADDNGPQWRNH